MYQSLIDSFNKIASGKAYEFIRIVASADDTLSCTILDREKAISDDWQEAIHSEQWVGTVGPTLAAYLGKMCTDFVKAIRSAEGMLVLISRQIPPPAGTRDDGQVRDFVCARSAWSRYAKNLPLKTADDACFSLAHAILSDTEAPIPIAAAQVPFDQNVRSPEALPPVGVIMAHRGDDDFLKVALHSLSTNPCFSRTGRIYLGLDVDAPDRTAAELGQFTHTSVLAMIPPAQNAYLIRQRLIAQIENFQRLAFHDSDDFSCSDRLQTLNAFMTQSDADIVGSHELRVDEILGQVRAFRLPLDVNAALRLGYSESLLMGTSLVNRKRFMGMGGFSTHHSIANDTQCLLRASFTLSIKNVDAFLYVRRRHAASLTASPATAFGTPLRTHLRDTWSNDFDRVVSGAINLAESSLAHCDPSSRSLVAL